MLSPADLLEIAEAFTNRIPLEPAYVEERDHSLLLLGKGFLLLGDDQSAARLLSQFSTLHPAGELRVLFVRWALLHPEFATARDVLRETVENVDQWEPIFSLKDRCDMVPAIYSQMGEQALRKYVDTAGDAYAKSAFVEEWIKLSANSEVREGLLAECRELAKQVDLDLASIGETGLGLDFQRTIDQAREALEKANAILPPPPLRPVDTPTDSLSRYLHYRLNDFKVRWLVDQAAVGGLDDWALELRIEGQEFQRIEPARQSFICTKVSHLDAAGFAAFLFDRPIPLSHADEELLGGYRLECWDCDPTHVVELATKLFRNFGTAARQFSEAQVDQGIWILLGHPLSLGEILNTADIGIDLRIACLEAMIAPFRDYRQTVSAGYSGGFFMWWDILRISSPDLVGTARAVLTQILSLPHWDCQKAAVHGLNHLRLDVEASAIIDRYLVEHRSEIPIDEIEWVERCRDGRAM